MRWEPSEISIVQMHCISLSHWITHPSALHTVLP
ncbi:hypothetical protein KPSA1_02569 [Pseudomonas syringae pv. actinidiae]|uniref:Uncharacterized protein n=1 Tax=Pseudomonas syringae pv. actinidiae TaxID=103796 RepID=A0A2V0R347_PSESF|nr:hypothetical protein KPSA1_02569 [Pseudomonas syringae pv. actinidiae]GBH16895.1 hypothetical protein KPSA3_02853 [Pseudomonas syringae pv. actinidiae]